MIDSFSVFRELIHRGYDSSDINKNIIDILIKEKDSYLISTYLSNVDFLYINDLRKLIIAFMNSDDISLDKISKIKKAITRLIREEEFFKIEAEVNNMVYYEKMLINNYYFAKVDEMVKFKDPEKICAFAFDSSYLNEHKLPFDYIDTLARAVMASKNIKWILFFAYAVPLAPRYEMFTLARKLGYKGPLYEVDSIRIVEDAEELPIDQRVCIIFGKKLVFDEEIERSVNK